MSTGFDYIAVGHVTRDVIEDSPGGPISQAGGGAFYSALQASRLGLRTLILTQGVPEEIDELIAPWRDELHIHTIAAKQTTTLSTRGVGCSRRQRLTAWAGAISHTLDLSASILHLAPVAQEVGVFCGGGSAHFIGLTPQGLIRRWEGRSGEIRPVQLDPSLLPARYDAAVISHAELPFCEPLIVAAADPRGPIIAVTAGERRTTLRLPGAATVPVTPIPVTVPADDLGAGDVFAAAFFVELASGRAPLQAASFASAAAAMRITRVGPDAIAGRAAIESLAKHALARNRDVE